MSRKPPARRKLFWATLEIAAALGIYAYLSFSGPQLADQASASESSSASARGSAPVGKRAGHSTSGARLAATKPSSRDVTGGASLVTADEAASPNATASLFREMGGMIPDEKSASHGWLASSVQELVKEFPGLQVREKAAQVASSVGSGAWDLTKRAAHSLRTHVDEMWSAPRASQPLPETTFVNTSGVAPAPAPPVPARAAPAATNAPVNAPVVVPLAGQQEHFY